jgi:hypothetical protein
MRDFFEDEPDYKEFLEFCSPELWGSNKKARYL